MRVIAGTARRLLLKTPDGLDTRPTADRIKETLFNMLMPYLPDAVFVDLFSGSGGIGIEALSRGARKAYFVENNSKAIACITDNIEHTHLTDKSVVLKQDVFAALRGGIRRLPISYFSIRHTTRGMTGRFWRSCGMLPAWEKIR